MNKRSRDGKVKLRVRNTDGSIAAEYIVEAEDAVPARREKLRQFLQAFLRMLQHQDHALARAQIGDWEELARHLDKGGEVTDETRKFLADVLRGRKRDVAHRPRKKAWVNVIKLSRWWSCSWKNPGSGQLLRSSLQRKNSIWISEASSGLLQNGIRLPKKRQSGKVCFAHYRRPG